MGQKSFTFSSGTLALQGGEEVRIDTPELDNIIENWEEIKNVITKGTDDIVLIEVYEGVEVVRENEMAKLPQENVIQGIRYRHVDNSFEIMSSKKPFTIESLPEPLRKLVASKFNNYLPNAKYSYIGFIEENSPLNVINYPTSYEVKTEDTTIITGDVSRIPFCLPVKCV